MTEVGASLISWRAESGESKEGPGRQALRGAGLGGGQAGAAWGEDPNFQARGEAGTACCMACRVLYRVCVVCGTEQSRARQPGRHRCTSAHSVGVS